ncbi:hypothetical protein Achl_4087 (plasmid) [Pseudarthrobacter chlorophenolicus A6]|uniref:Uncharacterized protein n=1 Tax=Pseudarthrobacter chlorophenolicus (strain ATCC 700700 / DSM 12829 / CIP 107037 / JCM 12360 / KCTC 9906 / NCIMB 13794 / A6) TaxID=452863 RepID=B8HHZ1_PSECP|nr:hypothetical protein [Pseudarthrobacter chlorophenolicus]ACL42038.1 hypothetical protein Achl_4087 [Pseudarthrobacter chlorophenolicus A6]SDQ20676.1 hypothetical protein SAMN04489738_0737 [Pseudarthrobacter chlorophenolicus]
MTPKLYLNIRPEQEDLIGALTERYAAQRIRFHTSFNGSVPVQACGRIGRRFFYFRFRGDAASLTIGSADHRGASSRAKHARRKALRELRRDQLDDGFMSFIRKRDLRRDTSLDRHPSRAVWYAVINDVTGDQWAGDLEPEESAELFVRLMDMLQPVPKRKPGNRSFAALRRGSYTPPSNWEQGIVRKPSKKRR